MTCGSCSTKQQVVTVTDTVYVRPPEYLLKPCAKTAPPKRGTNQDLLQYAISLGQDVDACNKQIRLIRKWNAQ